MTDYISKTDLLLALAELPQEASKREMLKAVYEMKTVLPDTVYKERPEWIDVREKEPRQGQLAAIYTPSRPNLYRVGRYMHFGNEDPWWSCGTTGLEARWVTHWLPIPALDIR